MVAIRVERLGHASGPDAVADAVMRAGEGECEGWRGGGAQMEPGPVALNRCVARVADDFAGSVGADVLKRATATANPFQWFVGEIAVGVGVYLHVEVSPVDVAGEDKHFIQAVRGQTSNLP